MILSPFRTSAMRLLSRAGKPQSCRAITTLSNNKHIYVFPNPHPLSGSSQSYVLSLLPQEPPNQELCIGTSTTIPPTPDSFSENPKFLQILDEVLGENAHLDEGAISQAKAFASTAGSSLGSGGSLFPQQSKSQIKRSGAGSSNSAGGDGAGGASSQGGAGGGGRGGWVHLSDNRLPPDYGRIAWPEDIFGSLQVDGNGTFVGDKGEWQPSGTYRLVTREGILGLSDFLRGKVVDRLKSEASS